MLGKFQGNLTFSAAAHAVKKELVATINTTGARIEVGVQLFENALTTLEQRGNGWEIIDHSGFTTTRRHSDVALAMACGYVIGR